MKITKDTLIVDILKAVEGSKAIFEKYNMACSSCMGVQNESLEKGCLMHGIDVNKILKEIENVKN